MMKCKYISLVGLFVISGLFANTFSQNPEIISIAKIKKNKENIALSYFCESVDYIKLETTDNCLLGKIGWCRRVGDRVVVLDRTTKLYYIFDLDGKFINKIGKVGKGPSEYLFNERSSYVNEDNKKIGIYDQGKTSYLEYDLTGNCVKEFKVDSNPEQVLDLDGYYVFFHPLVRRAINDWYTLSIVSSEGKLIRKVRKDLLTDNYSDAYRSFYKFDDEIHFWETQRDTIFSFNGDIIKPLYVLDLGKDKMPNEIWFDLVNIIERSSNYATILFVFESSNYLFLTLKDVGSIGRFIVWNKVTKEGYWVGRNKKHRQIGYENDINGGPLFIPGFMFSKDQLGQVLEVTSLKDKYEKGLINPQNKPGNESGMELIDIIEKSSIYDNPIIQIINIKTNEAG